MDSTKWLVAGMGVMGATIVGVGMPLAFVVGLPTVSLGLPVLVVLLGLSLCFRRKDLAYGIALIIGAVLGAIVVAGVLLRATSGPWS
jgi:hypothetical protein